MKRETILNINGVDYPAIIEYKKTKYVKYRYNDGKLSIKCPYFVTNNYLTEIISKTKFSKKIDKNEPAITDKYVYVFGEKQEIKDGFFNFNGHYILFNKDTFYNDIKKYANIYFENRILYYEQMMKIKQSYKVTCRLVTTRFGSNSRKTYHISFNLFLVHFNKDIIDSVVVHELAHDLYFDHSKEFYNVVYTYCPNYKQLHKALNFGNYEGVSK